MSKFVLTAQLQLQAPRNSQQVLKQVQSQLRGVNIPVQLKAGKQVQRQLQGITKDARRATSAAESLGRSFGLAVKRFAAFTVASRAVSLFTNSLASAVDEAISFQREIVKIAQVTGKAVGDLKSLEKTITSLSVNLGVSSRELLSVGRILSQAGIKARDLEVALSSLAKTTLAPTFENIEKTAEGAVAILAQFGEGVGALERQLGAINAVAGQFAVESGDLISAVRRFGGVFRSAGGSLEELLGLFTSVRATTRESSESIATGLRTIFTRIQRPRTIAFLKQFGVELLDVNGKFVGPLKAVEQLNKAFADLPQGDVRFIRIAEELGGFRQIGKVIPLIQQFEMAERARQAAIDGGNSLTKDAATAQQALAVQITKVKEEFLALVRGIANSNSFQIFTRTALSLASALIKIADALKPLIPLLGVFAAFKFAKGLGGFGAGVGSAVKGLGRNQGGAIQKFARGGYVPGSGNRDTVPAMLTPGEFVIKKSSAQKLGAGTLQQMNENKFALGGKVGAIALNPIGGKSSSTGKVTLVDIKKTLFNNNQLRGDTSGNKKIFDASSSGFNKSIKPKFAEKGKRPFRERFDRLIKKIAFGSLSKSSQNFKVDGASFPSTKKDESSVEDKIKRKLRDSFADIIPTAANDLKATLPASAGVKTGKFNPSIVKQIGLEDAAGKIFEGAVSSFGAPFSTGGGDQDDFDFPDGIGGNLAKFKAFSGFAKIATDAKKTLSKKELDGIANRKTKNFLSSQVNESAAFQQLKQAAIALPKTSTKESGKTRLKRNKGGGIPGSGDTVPALLTPGEFVVNKQAAQSIGYGNLNSMNNSGVARFNKGGAVQTFAGGGSVAGGGGGALNIIALTAAATAAQAAITKFGDKTDKASTQVAAWTIGLEKGVSGLIQLVAISIAVKALLSWTRALQNSQKEIQKQKESDKKSASASAAAAPKSDFDSAQDNLIKAQDNENRLSSQKENISAQRASAQETIAKGEKFDAATARKAQAEQNIQNLKGAPQSLSDRGVELEGQQEKRSRRIGELEAKKQVLDSGKGKGSGGLPGAGNVADPDKAGVRLNTKEIEAELATLRQDFQKGAKDLDLVQNEWARTSEELDKNQKEVAESNKILKENKVATDKLNAAKQKEDTLAKKEKIVTNNLRGATEARVAAEGRLDRQVEKVTQSENKRIAREKVLEQRSRTAAGLAGRLVKATTKYSIATAKLPIVLGKATISAVKADVAFKASVRGYRLARLGLKKLDRSFIGLRRSLKSARAGVRRLAAAAKNVGGRAVRGAKAGAARVGGGLAVGGGIAASVLAVGAQIASGFAEFFRRQERIAIASEDSAKAIEAAGKAAESENYGRAFSAEGLFAGFQSTFLGDDSGVNRMANDMASNIARSKAEAGFQVAQSTAVTDRRRLKEGKFTTGEGANAQVDFAKAGSRTIAAQNIARGTFGALSPAEREKKEAEFAASGTQLITDFANSGASLAELERTANGLAGLNQDQRKQYQILIKTLVAAREAQKAVNKANFDSLKITSAFGAAAAAVNNFTAGLETGSNTLAGYVSELEAAQQGIGIDASGAIDAIEQELVASAQGAGAGSLVSSLQGQANVARATNQFGVGAAGALEGLNLSTDTETAKQQLEAALISAIPKDADDSTKKKLKQQIEAQVAGIENIQTADLSAVVKGVVDAGGKLSAGFQQAAKLQAQHNQVMIGLYKKQEELEAKAAEAKNKAIDTQLEAAKIFEDFGGSKLTGGAKLGARVAQFNNVGGLGGLGAQLTSGSAGDIRQAQGKINQTFFDQTDQFKVNAAARSVAGGGPGAFAGAQGIRDDKREEAKKANAALITFTKQRIQLLKEELSIVQKKNAEEKSALDKLISGDVEGFLEGQAAAGAGAALRSGDASLAGLFGTSALGAGFKSLEGQGLSDQQLRSAEDLTLQRFGIQSTGVLSGTTSEEQALNSQGREFAGIFGDLAGDQAAFAQAEFTVQEAVINATNATFSNKLKEVAEQNKDTKGGQSNVAGFFRGGPVYANRGMFVPRGTDTVPAMLTPGEFVVNRSSVQRGNNLQILRAMNSGGGASGQSKMRGGGVVRYYQDGGSVAPAISPEGITQLQGVFTQFAESVDKLVNSQFSVKLDTTNVNVNFNGASFLSTLKDDIKSELLETVKAEIGKAKPNNSGDIKTGNTVLGN